MSEDEIEKLMQAAMNDYAETMINILMHAHASTLKPKNPAALRKAARKSVDECVSRVQGNRGKGSPFTATDAKLIMVAVCRECIRIVEGGQS